MILRHISFILALAIALPGIPGACASVESGEGSSETSAPAKIKLQGHAEMQQFQRDMQAWQASQLYRQGAYLMAVNDFSSAAECFKQAGDGFDTAIGPSRFMAEARYAEAQCRRLMNQNAKAVQLFQVAVDMFEECDPRNPFLKAGRAYLDQLSGGKTAMRAKATKTKLTAHASQQQLLPMHFIAPHNDFIDNRVALKGNVTELVAETETKMQTELKDAAIFGGKRLQEPMMADVSDKFVHDVVYKAFLDMTCLEMAALGGNYYTAPDSYKAFKAGGKTVVTGATESVACPSMDMKLNGREYTVPINLPGMKKETKNVLLATDGLHVIAVDPRTTDTWRLTPDFSKPTADFSWFKLTHKKDPPKPTYTARSVHVSSPFAR
jgi:hypothetical protein